MGDDGEISSMLFAGSKWMSEDCFGFCLVLFFRKTETIMIIKKRRNKGFSNPKRNMKRNKNPAIISNLTFL